ncbi:hypothetical protein P689_12295 [Candidatus Riesia pediculischaeffi PTSU]|uniref:Uncharacterized protein n=1 Tax=Candidatus Riesia pediculischaeffi PTSU TaxID=1401651 RepID=A0A0C1S9H7_9ENTR|nr:hypothetical protein P689_12295 [Candidatus Riesia pediculischaeffi PTSU]
MKFSIFSSIKNYKLENKKSNYRKLYDLSKTEKKIKKFFKKIIVLTNVKRAIFISIS